MRASALLVSLLLFTHAASAAPASDEAQLRHLKTVLWPQAYREQDAALLDRILHKNFQSIDAQGLVTRKQDELDYVRKHKPSYESFRYDIERLEIFQGGYAVVSGEGVVRSAAAGGAQETRYRSSNYFLKEDGGWRAIGSHVSGVKSAPVPQR